MLLEIAVLPGDGIGPEIMVEAIKVLETVGRKYNHQFDFRYTLIGGAAWDKYGVHLPEETLRICDSSKAILLASVGGPVSEQLQPKWLNVSTNALLPLRKRYDLFANFRPARLYRALKSACPLRSDIAEKGFDILVLRELTGDAYFGQPKGRDGSGKEERAFDNMVYSRREVERIAHVAFRTARKRRKKVTSIDKANVLDSSILWREVVEEIAREYPDVTCDSMFADNAAMQLIRNPSQFDVMLCGNLFGDILSDEAVGITGSLGLGASASIGEGAFGLYEPSAGSAPDIAGKGIANPIAQILSAAMMLQYTFNLEKESRAIEEAVEKVLDGGKVRTPDIGGSSTTAEIGAAIVKAL
jgi:3-isopropylmalate dehydrogenase